jgi:CelD/BcsL family acetyltransferase involved in cellulose biosynthesis
MRVTVLHEIPQDEVLSRKWNQIVERMEHPEVFFTYQWAMAASRAFRTRLRPLLFLVYDADELCGVAALALTPEAPRVASFLTASTADYCDIVSTPGTRASVLECLMQEITKLQLHGLTLASLPADSATWKDLPSVARAQGFHLASRSAYECGIVEFGSEDQRRSMLHVVKHKSREQRGLKKLSQLGTVQLTHVMNPDEATLCLPRIISAQIARFLSTHRISPLVQPERRAFLQELTSLLAREGWLKISQLDVSGQAVAWNYGFRFADSWFWYLPSFKVESEDCSPGSCLLRLLVEEGCADSSLRWLDLGLGDESYKSRFATTVRKTRYLQLSRSLRRHGLVSVRQLATIGTMRFPDAGARARQAREVLRSLSHRVHATGWVRTIAYMGQRAVRLGVSRDEVLLFEGTATQINNRSSMRLDPVTWEHLAEAAIENSDDPETLQYLLRVAARLKKAATSAFLLRDQTGAVVHFLCVASLDGFYVDEINHKLDFGEHDGAMIFDCWTPARYRGMGYYPLAICLAASELRNNGKKPWILSAATNGPSIRGILKAGFTYRFSFVRRRKLGATEIVRQDGTSAITNSITPTCN